MSAIEISDVTVRYRAVVAVRNASLTVGAGRICGLIGVNGSGKSTLLKVMAGVVHPDEGRVQACDRPLPQARSEGLIGYVAQSDDIDWNFQISVTDVVMTGRYAHLGWTRRPRAHDREKVTAAIAEVGLTDLAERQIGQLSGGQRKRVFVARALAQEIDLLLLDEPFAGIDIPSQQTITTILRGLAHRKVTIIVATHNLGQLPQLCDEAALINRTVLLHDSPETVLQPHNLIRAFGLDPTTEGGPS